MNANRESRLPPGRGLRFGVVLLCALALGGDVRSESIWDRRSRQDGFLFEDNFARRVGDLLIIRIRESTTITENDQRNMEKATDARGAFNFQGTIGNNSANASMSSGTTSDRSFEGSAQYSSGRVFNDQVTVKVVDVLPNGNLVVQGFRRRVTSTETRMLRLSGIVRPNDIEIGNFVDSPKVANFQVTYEGRGPETSFTRQGILGRIGNRVWPF